MMILLNRRILIRIRHGHTPGRHHPAHMAVTDKPFKQLPDDWRMSKESWPGGPGSNIGISSGHLHHVLIAICVRCRPIGIKQGGAEGPPFLFDTDTQTAYSSKEI